MTSFTYSARTCTQRTYRHVSKCVFCTNGYRQAVIISRMASTPNSSASQIHSFTLQPHTHICAWPPHQTALHYKYTALHYNHALISRMASTPNNSASQIHSFTLQPQTHICAWPPHQTALHHKYTALHYNHTFISAHGLHTKQLCITNTQLCTRCTLISFISITYITPNLCPDSHHLVHHLHAKQLCISACFALTSRVGQNHTCTVHTA